MSGFSDVKTIIPVMVAFGLLGSYSNLLVMGTSKSETSLALYDYLKRNLKLNPDARPQIYTRYDFIYLNKEYTAFETFGKFLGVLRPGGIILLECDNKYFNIDTIWLNDKVKILKINKKLEILKGE